MLTGSMLLGMMKWLPSVEVRFLAFVIEGSALSNAGQVSMTRVMDGVCRKFIARSVD